MNSTQCGHSLINSWRKLLITSLFSGVLLTLLSACQQAEPVSAQSIKPNESDRAIEQVQNDTSLRTTSIARLKTRIDQQLALQFCETSTDCRLVGLGARPCGGPDSYHTYSTAVVDEKQFLQDVERYNQLVKLHNQKERILGICEIAIAPGITCQKNSCVTVPTDASVTQ